jgi:hypothetical protein
LVERWMKDSKKYIAQCKGKEIFHWLSN